MQWFRNLPKEKQWHVMMGGGVAAALLVLLIASLLSGPPKHDPAAGAGALTAFEYFDRMGCNPGEMSAQARLTIAAHLASMSRDVVAAARASTAQEYGRMGHNQWCGMMDSQVRSFVRRIAYQ